MCKANKKAKKKSVRQDSSAVHEEKMSAESGNISSSLESGSEKDDLSRRHRLTTDEGDLDELNSSSSDDSCTGEEHDISCECNECLEEKLEVKARLQYLISSWVERALQKGITGLRKEFHSLHSEVVPPAEACQEYFKNCNTGRNRYGNVYCLDKTRLKLRVEPNANDYIHANYISTPFKDHRFICTQGPTTTTITDFWLMVWQEHVEFIIMLSNFEEKGKEKCARYFPEKSGSTLRFDQFTVNCISCAYLRDSVYPVLCRELSIKADGRAETVFIKHYQWTEWPDHSVPETDLSILRVLDTVRMSVRPIVVHCSAGIGRSGVIVATEYVLEAITYQEDCSDMCALLKKLRKQRAGIVQTVQQYLFVHRLLLLFFMDTKRLKPTEAINNFINEYESFVH